MHKIKYVKSIKGITCKERCEDQDLSHAEQATIWAYPITDGKDVCCSHCRRQLRGRALMERQAARILYQIGGVTVCPIY